MSPIDATTPPVPRARLRLRDLSDEDLNALTERFAAATPWPHVVLDDVLEGDPEELSASWPEPDWPMWTRFDDGYQRGKMFCQDIAAIPEPWAGLLTELSAPWFLAFLERVSGIKRLLPDPYYEGGGLHCSGTGGVLAPHTDFHIYDRLDLYRQINVLLYLNPDWPAGAGGELELWAKGASAPAATVSPQWGRCVIFRTDDQSVHGFSQAVDGGDRWRRSIATYYYTSQENVRYSGDTTTYWQAHGRHGVGGRARLYMYRSLVLAARGVAHLAHRANPNFSRGGAPGDPD